MDMADCCVVIDIEKEENSIMVLIVAVPRSIFFAEQSYCTVLFFLFLIVKFIYCTSLNRRGGVLFQEALLEGF